MRRALTLLLVSIFGLLGVVPGLLANDQPDLPACCRRLGAHHCAMVLAETPPGPAFKAVCPEYRLVLAPAVPVGLKSVIPGNCGPVFASAVQHETAPAQPLSHLHASFSRSRQKRGPPGLPL